MTYLRRARGRRTCSLVDGEPGGEPGDQARAISGTRQQGHLRLVVYWTEDGGPSVGDPVATEIARLLGWSAEEPSDNLAAYRDWVSANRLGPLTALSSCRLRFSALLASRGPSAAVRPRG